MSEVDAGVDGPAWQAELERVEALVGGPPPLPSPRFTCVTSTLNWSCWRRRRQHQARAYHYCRRAADLHDHKLPWQY